MMEATEGETERMGEGKKQDNIYTNYSITVVFNFNIK